ncbi:MAG: hypothetical protein IH962_04535 [Chloroflexi bacterium]|nr:hypothetical protein [Chloroflexota bacterium]
MGTIIVKTKFNASGKRKLTKPITHEKVGAPAYHRYKQAYQAADEEWRRRLTSADQSFCAGLANLLTFYVTDPATPNPESKRIIGLLVEGMLNSNANGSNSWAVHLGLPALSDQEGKWQAERKQAYEARESAIQSASEECDDMKRALWREVDVAFGIRPPHFHD